MNEMEERLLNTLELGIEQIPNARLDSVGITQDEDRDWLPLAVARQTADTLVKAHRVPGHVDVHKGGAALLPINSFASCLRGNKKTDLALVERVRCGLTRPLPGGSDAL